MTVGDLLRVVIRRIYKWCSICRKVTLHVDGICQECGL